MLEPNDDQTMSTDTERKVVKAYLPSYQKEEWRGHAEELGMNQSEFVKSMVQAGRRGFAPSTPDEPRSEVETPGVDDLEDEVLDVLGDEYRSWEELVELLTENIEDRLETTLQRLQRENQVQYSGRQGGYAVMDSDGD